MRVLISDYNLFKRELVLGTRTQQKRSNAAQVLWDSRDGDASLPPKHNHCRFSGSCSCDRLASVKC